MPLISQEQFLLQKGLTAEQINLITWFYSVFDDRSAVNRRIIDVDFLFYQGLIAGSEFLTYNASKLYICFDSQFSWNNASQATVTGCWVISYDAANAICNYYSNVIPVWDVVAAGIKYTNPDLVIKNFYFSRIDIGGLTTMKFNGFRVTLQ
jgi:hypothetical protein